MACGRVHGQGQGTGTIACAAEPCWRALCWLRKRVDSALCRSVSTIEPIGVLGAHVDHADLCNALRHKSLISVHF